MTPAVTLTKVSPEILSSYSRDGKMGSPRSNLQFLADMKMGIAAPEVVPALLKLHQEVLAQGGDFRVTELHRDYFTQEVARAKYDLWVKSGKPKPGTSAFNSKTMKTDFVALPGRSMHNGGRAIDFHVGALKFPGISADKQLDKMWEICQPIGWTPVIKIANEGASESWHLDYWGELSGVKDRLGYEQGALCGAILVGHSGDCQTFPHITQALLQRAGFNIGAIDGDVGPKTLNALTVALGLNLDAAKSIVALKDESVYAKLLSLPAK